MDKTAVINPVAGKKSPVLGSVAVMAATLPDLNLICHELGVDKQNYIDFATSRLYPGDIGKENFTIAGPFTGAPHAVILLENLIACGVKKIIFIGWCGAVSPNVKIGDIILATGAFSDEGTSRHYCEYGHDVLLETTEPLFTLLSKALTRCDLPFKTGALWSTDAIFRETRQKIKHYQAKGVLAVEMEYSALISVCHFRQVEVASIQVVSDELSSFVWTQGFGDKRFKKSRKTVAQLIVDVCRGMKDGNHR